MPHLVGQSSKTQDSCLCPEISWPIHYTERKRIRKSFGSRDSVLEVPYLLQMQKDAYTAFLQADVAPQKTYHRRFAGGF
jgi:DNA-directed RNA polymerase beta subunit